MVNRILVDNGSSKFWVKNPKKIKFWKGLVGHPLSRIRIIREEDE